MKIVKNALFVTLLLAITTVSSFATKWHVTFTFPTYTPSDFTVAVGDTVVWMGSFASHPLESVSVPPNAAAFSNNVGNEYSYIVTVAGKYDYKCTFHVDQGMKGSFTATTASVKSTAPNTISLSSYPNPSVKSVAFHFVLPEASNVMMKLYDIKGNLVADVLNEYRASGTNEASFNTTTLAAGTYICKFSAGVYQSAQEIVVVK